MNDTHLEERPRELMVAALGVRARLTHRWLVHSRQVEQLHVIGI